VSCVTEHQTGGVEGSTEPQADQYPDRPHLRDSRQLNWSRTTKSAEALRVIDQLVAEVDAQAVRKRARKADDRRRLQATLNAMVLDLVYAAEQPSRPWVAYSRREADYGTALTRYLSPDVTFTAARETANFLANQGYAEGRAGSYSRTDHGGGCISGRGYRSRLRAKSKLVDLFRSHGVSQADIEHGEAEELIRLKGSPEGAYGRKPLLPYEDTDATRRMRQQLRDWAAVVNSFDIKAADADQGDDLEPEGDDEPAEYADPTTASLYRVFNDGSWGRGGRFYGGWWQSLPKAVRQTITINGEPTVELDFKALHPRLLYHLAKQPVPADVDPYAMGEPWQDVDRGVLKVAFNQLLAITGDGTPKKPAKAQLPPGATYKALVNAIEVRHAPVDRWFRRGRASELQNLDARIAEGVLGYFTVAIGRPVLPVHDSFIVATRDERKLGETMCLAYRAVLNDLSGVSAWPVIAGWTSKEVKQATYAPLLAAYKAA
jgi:hypothetical protein